MALQKFSSELPNSIKLEPLSVRLSAGGLSATADVYFLLGNDIPGPPGISPQAASFFGISVNANEGNRELMNQCANPAKGTGIAVGAGVDVAFEAKKRIKIFFAKITLYDIRIRGGAGFDLALIKYGSSTTCADQDSHGVNGFRATGRIWAYVDVYGKVLGFPVIPGLGVGVLLKADIPNPSYFKAKAVLRILGFRIKFNLSIGDECGHPCSSMVGDP